MSRQARRAQDGAQSEPQVVALYRAALDRLPDADGARHYARRLRRGEHFEDLLHELARSREAQGRNFRSQLQRRLREQVWRGRRDPADPQLVFLHVMKTGGTTLNDALRDNIGRERHIVSDLLLDDLLCMPPYAIDSAALVTGHLPFETLTLLPGRTLTFTLLRDPLERTISHWWHVRQQAGIIAAVGELSLETFLDTPPWRTLACNYQARHLGHEIGLAAAWRDWSPVERYAALGDGHAGGTEYPLQSLFDCSALAGEARLEARALANLEAVDIVDVTEHSDRVYQRLADRVDYLPPIATPQRRNVGRRRPRSDDLDAGLLAKIRERNRVDQRLYEAALARGRDA